MTRNQIRSGFDHHPPDCHNNTSSIAFDFWSSSLRGDLISIILSFSTGLRYFETIGLVGRRGPTFPSSPSSQSMSINPLSAGNPSSPSSPASQISSSSPPPPPTYNSKMIKGKPYHLLCLQRLRSNFVFIIIFCILLVMAYLGVDYFEITPSKVSVLSPDRSDYYKVKVLPAALSDDELIKLPPETFSYIAMIDAGSSGCRAHIYRYGKLGSLQGPLYLLPQHNSKKIKPGLSSFADDPNAAGASLSGLVDFMKSEVPASDWPVTPVFLKATAGLRMLPSNVSQEILQSVRQFLSDKSQSPFFFLDSYAQIISGNEEGGFGWIAFNYLKRIIGPRAPTGDAKPDPYAVIEMGGASAQVSQAAPDEAAAQAIPDQYRFSFAIEKDHYHLYTHSYLGYGAEQARELYNKHIGHAPAKAKESEMCYNPGYYSGRYRERRSLLSAPIGANTTATNLDETKNSEVGGSGNKESSLHASVSALITSCLKNMALLFRTVNARLPTSLRHDGDDASGCTFPAPRSFNCVYQPDFVVQSKKILAFENFFYVSSALGVRPFSSPVREEGVNVTVTKFPLQTTPSHLYSATHDFCKSDWTTIQEKYPVDGQPKDVNIKACFVGTYAYSFLVDGLRLPSDKVITIQREVDGSEIEWALGAAYKEAAGFLKRRHLRPT
eukprot:scaffold3227_cov188-Ochromonas_danica.AAC.23